MKFIIHNSLKKDTLNKKALAILKKEKFINAEYLAKQGISLPIDPNLSIKNLDTIVKVLNSF